MPWLSWPAAALEGGRLPQTGGVRPQLTVTVDLDGLLGRHGSLGGEAGGAGPLDPEACQRLACDGALTRVLVTRHPTGHRGPGTGGRPATRVPSGEGGLAARLRAAVALLPPVLGGAPAEPLEVGRTSRVVLPAQRTALAVRDGGCVFPGCSRPLAWCKPSIGGLARRGWALALRVRPRGSSHPVARAAPPGGGGW